MILAEAELTRPQGSPSTLARVRPVRMEVIRRYINVLVIYDFRISI